MTRDFTLSLVGAGGDGVVTMGDMLARAGAREGLNAMKTDAYGPQIRGGESSSAVRLSPDPIYSQGDAVDVMVIFSWSGFARFQSEIVPAQDAIIFHEATDPVPAEFKRGEQMAIIPVPFIEMAKAASGTGASKNIVALGMLCGLFHLPVAPLRATIERKFKKKGDDVVASNLAALEAGATLDVTKLASGIADLQTRIDAKKLEYEPSTPKLLMSGNEATAVGAMYAGCKFFAGYPITPSSEVLHFLGDWLPRVGGRMLQTEDELAAYGAVIGASFAGKKSMTATSGPGLSLMSELLGLSAIAEIPSVIYNVQRGGPSTGIPTKSEQSDLFHAVYGGHGDTPRVVIAPTDVEDSFHCMVEAFNISEEFQIPVIILSDQLIAQRIETLDEVSLVHEVRERRLPNADELVDYQRYRETPSGVSPMSNPGIAGGIYQTNGLEHDEYGSPNAGYLMHEQMNAKRFRKLWGIRSKYHFFRRYGPEKASVGIVTWGSMKGPAEEVVKRAAARGQAVSAFIPQVLLPFPKNELEQFIASCDQILIVEQNYMAQFYKYLRTFTDLPAGRTHVFKMSGGRPMTVTEIETELMKVLEPASEPAEVMA
ncbi:MAG: 2-oxoacid:acceptor oxidoreductase subunit alpha [Thermoanaerobaculia bacterium]